MKTLTTSPLKALCLMIVLFVLVTACQKNDLSIGSQMVSLYLTDDPSMTFDNLFIDIQKVEIKTEDDDETEDESGHRHGNGSDDGTGDISGGWITLNSNTGVYDILSLKNGVDTLLSSGFLPTSKPTRKIRLTLGTNNMGVLNGVTYPLPLKKNQVEIDVEKGISATGIGGNIKIWLDFDGNLSIRKKGNEFELQPSIRPFTKDLTGSIEGKVLPANAKAIVFAVNGVDTTTAKPEREGEFKIMGLKSGNYKLIVHPTVNGFSDVTIPNVVVRSKEDSHVGNIQLKN
jgi:hypothetical protein